MLLKKIAKVVILTAGIIHASQADVIKKTLEDAIKNKYDVSIKFESVSISDNESTLKNKKKWDAWGITSNAQISKYIGVFDNEKLVEFWLDVNADTLNDTNLANLKSKAKYLHDLIHTQDSLDMVMKSYEERNFQKNHKSITAQIHKQIKKIHKFRSIRIDSVSLQNYECMDTLPECWKRIKKREYLVYALINDTVPSKYTAHEINGKISQCELDIDSSNDDPYIKRITDSINSETKTEDEFFTVMRTKKSVFSMKSPQYKYPRLENRYTYENDYAIVWIREIRLAKNTKRRFEPNVIMSEMKVICSDNSIQTIQVATYKDDIYLGTGGFIYDVPSSPIPNTLGSIVFNFTCSANSRP